MKKTFYGKKDFEAFYSATEWLKEQGLHTGSMECDRPIGISKDDWVAGMKWRNIYQNGRNALDGVICSDEYRNGSVTIIIFDANDRNCYFRELGENNEH